MRFLFEDYALDTERRELCRRGEVVRIEPQAFDLLEYLIQNRGRLVSRDDFTLRVPNVRQGHVFLAANLAQLGQLDEAHAEAAEILRIDPKYTIDGTQRQLALFKRTEDVERFLDGLRKAGLPEK